MSRALPEPELLAAAKAGSAAAQDKLIRMSMWVVRARVRMWTGDPDDLTQIALTGGALNSKQFGGLMRAIETFDPEGGQNFWSHATKAIDMALSRSQSNVERPRRKGGRQMSIDRLTEERIGSTDHRKSAGLNYAADFPELTHQSTPEQVAGARSVLELIEKLPERRRVALLSYYAEGLNMKAVGERLGVSRQRAVQLVEDAKARLRKMMQEP